LSARAFAAKDHLARSLRSTPAKRQHHLACAARGLRCAEYGRCWAHKRAYDAFARASGTTSVRARWLMLCGPRSRASWSPSGGPRRPLGSAAPARDVNNRVDRRVLREQSCVVDGCSRASGLRRPPDVHHSALKLRAFGRRPQSISTVSSARAVAVNTRKASSAHALAADARKASRPSRALARLQPTPIKHQDRLERSCGCGRHPQAEAAKRCTKRTTISSSRPSLRVHVLLLQLHRRIIVDCMNPSL
jgi:hypothetical protein